VDLQELKVFAQVADYGSLSRAAIMLKIGQPSLSRRIAALERECGGRLFSRTGRGLELSELGSRLLPRVRALLAEADRIASEARTMAATPAGEVNVGVLPSTACQIVPPLFHQCRQRFPDVRLHIFEGFSGQIEEWLADGRVEVATLFRHSNAVGRGERPLGVVDTCLVGAKGDPVTRAKTVKFPQLHRLPLILPAPNSLRVTLDHLARKRGIELNVVMESNSIPIQNALVAQGGCYAVSSFYSVSRDVHAGALQAARIVAPSIDRRFTIGTTTQRPLGLAAREVAKLMREIVLELIEREPSLRQRISAFASTPLT